MMSQPRRLWLE